MSTALSFDSGRPRGWPRLVRERLYLESIRLLPPSLPSSRWPCREGGQGEREGEGGGGANRVRGVENGLAKERTDENGADRPGRQRPRPVVAARKMSLLNSAHPRSGVIIKCGLAPGYGQIFRGRKLMPQTKFEAG